MPDFLSGKQVRDDGALSMLPAENSHEAIMDKEIFGKVQEQERVHQSNKRLSL